MGLPQAADGIVSTWALHDLGDPEYTRSVYAASRRVLKTGGVFLNGCLPIFTTIVAWFWLRQRSRPVQIVGLIVILAGIVLLVVIALLLPILKMTTTI